MSKAHLDTDLSFSRLGGQVYQLSWHGGQNFASYLSCLQHTPFSPSPHCKALLMNLNLLPQQLPSIIPASTANSSPASHFSPLKKSFISLLAVMELPRSLAWEMISQQACGQAAFHRWKVRLHVWFWALLEHCTCMCSARACRVLVLGPVKFWDGELHPSWSACSALIRFLIKNMSIIIPSTYPFKSVLWVRRWGSIFWNQPNVQFLFISSFIFFGLGRKQEKL